MRMSGFITTRHGMGLKNARRTCGGNADMKTTTLALLLASATVAAGQTTNYYNGVVYVWELHYSAGQIELSGGTRSGDLQLSVEGRINSVSLKPFFNVLSDAGQLLTNEFGFNVSVEFENYPFRRYVAVFPYQSESAAVRAPSDSESSGIALRVDGESPYGPASLLTDFFDYRRDHLSENQTFQLGFEAESLTYTPVPEPSIVAVFGVGLCGLLHARKKHNEESKSRYRETNDPQVRRSKFRVHLP
jgi:hypothetical protein